MVSCCGVLGGLRVKRQALSGLLSTPDLEPPCGCPVWVVAVGCSLWVAVWFGVLGFAAACLAGWFGWLGCGWWVVGELYSGCFVSLFCVIFVFVLVFCFCGRSVDALVSRADEGRGGLRYALGS